MDEATRRAREAIEEAVREKPPEGPVVLSQEYLRLVERAEQLPQNRLGTDKSWTERVLAAWKYDVESSRRIPRE